MVAVFAIPMFGLPLLMYVGHRWPRLDDYPWALTVPAMAFVLLPVPWLMLPRNAYRWEVTETSIRFVVPSRMGPYLRARDNGGFVRLRIGWLFTTAYCGDGTRFVVPTALHGPKGVYRFHLQGDKLRLVLAAAGESSSSASEAAVKR